MKVGDTVKVAAALKGAPDETYKIIRNTDGKLALDDVMGTALDELKQGAVQLVKKEGEMKKDKIMCCCLGCTKEAEYVVVYGNAPTDATESCVQHVGLLAGDAESFEVHKI